MDNWYPAGICLLRVSDGGTEQSMGYVQSYQWRHQNDVIKFEHISLCSSVSIVSFGAWMPPRCSLALCLHWGFWGAIVRGGVAGGEGYWALEMPGCWGVSHRILGFCCILSSRFKAVWELARRPVHKVYCTRYPASLYLWWIKAMPKCCGVSSYYFRGCISWVLLTTAILSHTL